MVSTEAAVVIESSAPSQVAASVAAAIAVAAEVETIKTTESMLTNPDLSVPILDFDKYALFLFFFIFAIVCLMISLSL